MNLVREKLNFVPMVGDGLIGDPSWGAGRLIPVLILDCAAHPSLEDLILAHKDTPPGDVTTTWGWNFFSKKKVYLTFRFYRPVETSATVVFDVSSQGGIVDCIINVRGVYLQPVTSGAKVSEGMGKPKILVEVSPAATFPAWKKIYFNSLEKSYRRLGLSKLKAATAAKDHVARLREIQFRQKPRSTSQDD